jgi:hypothetical protein
MTRAGRTGATKAARHRPVACAAIPIPANGQRPATRPPARARVAQKRMGGE